MLQPDTEKSSLISYEELKEGGDGFKLIAGAYDNPDINEGFPGSVPPGLEVRCLGDYPEASWFPMGEFVVFDPQRVEVLIERFEGTDETEAVTRKHSLTQEGWQGQIRPYRDHFVNLAWRAVTPAQQ